MRVKHEVTCWSCRYGMKTYRSHYVCTGCRVSFKHTPPGSYECPHCGGPMIDAGKDLHVPRRADKRAWRVLVALLESGVRFHSCGCCGPGYRPRTPRELKAWTPPR